MGFVSLFLFVIFLASSTATRPAELRRPTATDLHQKQITMGDQISGYREQIIGKSFPNNSLIPHTLTCSQQMQFTYFPKCSNTAVSSPATRSTASSTSCSSQRSIEMSNPFAQASFTATRKIAGWRRKEIQARPLSVLFTICCA